MTAEYDDEEKLLDKIKVLSQRITETESLLSAFFNFVPGLLCIATKDGYFYKLNHEWERELGWSIAELCAKPYKAFVHPEDIEKTSQIEKVMENGEKAKYFTNRYLCKDGTYKYICWHASNYIDDKYIYSLAYVVNGESVS